MSQYLNTTDIYTSNTIEPNFNWQVGFNNFNVISSGVQFRVTIRPLTNFEQFSRIPNPIVLYEETGVVLDGSTNLGLWTFSLNKNTSITGGPYRDYQVVVEAHDENGNTSAGNVVGSYGDSENGWTAYGNGYDIIAIKNPRPSGIELSNSIPTQISGGGDFIPVTGQYSSLQSLGSNGEIVIDFNSGSFNSDIVGGFIYCSNIPFPKNEVLNYDPYWSSLVQKTRFDFDPIHGIIYHPTAAYNIKGAPYGYVSVSFFDTLDKELLDGNPSTDISTGLYLSNNAIIYNNTSHGTITLGGTNTLSTVSTTGYPAIGSARLYQLIGSGSIEIARNSIPDTSNSETTLTTIFYISLPLSLPYTGVAGQGSGSSSTPTSLTGVLSAGGFYSGALVVMANGTTKPISQVNVGDSVLSASVSNYNSTLDNWSTYSYVSTGVITTLATGIVTQVLTGISNYQRFTDGAASIFILTGQPMVATLSTLSSATVNFIQTRSGVAIKNIAARTGKYSTNNDSVSIFSSGNLITGYGLKISPNHLYWVKTSSTVSFFTGWLSHDAFGG